MDQRAQVERRKEKGVVSFIGKDEKTEKLWERESSRLTRWKESG